MNRRLLDPFKSVGLPEIIDEYLQEGTARHIAFNRRGTILAAGTEEGQIVYWDYDTRGVARVDTGHSKPVVGLSWSRDGRFMASVSSEGCVLLWDVEHGKLVHRIDLNKEVVQVSMSPLNHNMCVASTATGPPELLDFSSGTSQVLQPISAGDGKTSSSTNSNSQSFGAIATFHKSGALIFVGTSKGLVIVYDAATLHVVDIHKVAGAPKVVGLTFNRRGDLLLLNCHDKLIRMFAVTAPGPSDVPLPPATLESELVGRTAKQGSLVARNVLTPVRDLSNAVERVPWKSVCFSSDSEYVIGAAGTKNKHHFYIWNCHHGKLERILEGPKETVQLVLWHPTRPSTMLSVSSTGKILIWSKIYEENWSAFAPDFQELDENQEYVEREDEFDLNDIQQRVDETRQKRYAGEEEEEEDVDIMTMDRHTVFSSDDEDGEGELLHLPVEIKAEVLEDVPAGGGGQQWPDQQQKEEEGAVEEGEEEAMDTEEDGAKSSGEALIVEGPRTRKPRRWQNDGTWPQPTSHKAGYS